MNPEAAHGWLGFILGIPMPGWAALASAAVGLALPWLIEANVPMADWSGWKFRLTTYLVAILAGLAAGVTLWHSWSALALWVPALAINCARDIASHFLPWLSPRQQQLVVRRDASGQVVAIKDGNDPTLIVTRPPATPTSAQGGLLDLFSAVPGVWGVIVRWAALAGVCLAFTAAVSLKVWFVATDAQANRDKAANAQAQAANFKVYQHDIGLSDTLSAQLSTSKTHAASLSRTLQSEITHANDLTARLDAAHADLELTDHAVCLWERAWAAANLLPGEAGPGSVRDAACVPGTPAQPSGYDLRDTLYSDAEQAGVCGDIRRQLIQLQAFEAGAGNATP